MAGEFETENRDYFIMDTPDLDLYPIAKLSKLELPTYFNDNFSRNHLDCIEGNIYEDTRSAEKVTENLSIKADRSIPKSCGIYYFEITLLSENIFGTLSLGYSYDKNIDKELGCSYSSVGLHLNNKQSANLKVQSKENPIEYSEELNIKNFGIGINFIDHSVFCTVNGVLILPRKDLPNKDKFLSEAVYPVISSQSPKCKFLVNLGIDNSKPFKFNFLHYKSTQLREKRKQCLSQEYSPKLAFVTVHNLVSDYLLHHGYAESWEYLHKYDNNPNKCQSIETIRNRRLIQSSIVEHDYLGAISCIDKYFPEFFQQFPIYKFVLKCRHFINLIITKPLFNGQDGICINGTDSSDTCKIDTCNSDVNETIGKSLSLSKSMKMQHTELRANHHHQQQHPQRRQLNHNHNGSHIQDIVNMDDDDDDDADNYIDDDDNDEDANDDDNNNHSRTHTETTRNDHSNNNNSNNNGNCENDDDMNDSNLSTVYHNNERTTTSIANNNNVGGGSDSGGCNDLNLVNQDEHLAKQHNDNDIDDQSDIMDTENTLTTSMVTENTKSFVHNISGEQVMYIIEYGKCLNEEAKLFASTYKDNRDHEEGVSLLKKAFGLIAYKDPYNSPFKEILRYSERENLANKINGAINGMLGRTTKARLDCLLESSTEQTLDNSTPILAAIHPRLLLSELLIVPTHNSINIAATTTLSSQ